MKTIYIAGKISGLPYHRTYFKFLIREIMLRLLGYIPINPMRLIPNNWNYEDQIICGCKLAEIADCIYLSHNWKKSFGVIIELKSYIFVGKSKIRRFGIFGLRKVNNEIIYYI